MEKYLERGMEKCRDLELFFGNRTGILDVNVEEKKRKGKKKKSQKNQMDLVINQGISTSGFTSGHQLPVKF